MNLPKPICTQILSRFDELIQEGQNILGDAPTVAPSPLTNRVTGETISIYRPYKRLDNSRFVEWRTKASTLLGRVIMPDSIHHKAAEEFPGTQASEDLLDSAISFMKGVRDDFDRGLLGSLASQIEAEIACNYMGQAEELLAEGQRGKCDHVPAAVLAGAVLEKTLRTIAEGLQPPNPTVAPSGEHKKLNLMIDELKKAGVFNEAKAKHPLELHDDIAWEAYCPVSRLGEHVGEEVVTCGLIVEQRTHHQITGEPMKFLTLADWTGMVETELFAQTYRRDGQATVRYPVLEIAAKVEAFENGRGFSLRVLRAGKPRQSVDKVASFEKAVQQIAGNA